MTCSYVCHCKCLLALLDDYPIVEDIIATLTVMLRTTGLANQCLSIEIKLWWKVCMYNIVSS